MKKGRHRGSAAYAHYYRAGVFIHCRALSGIGAQGGGQKKVSTTEAAAEAENIFFHQPKGPLEARREESGPQTEQHIA